MNDLDAIVGRLLAVTNELRKLGGDEFTRRFELEIERDELRAAAKEFTERKDERRTINDLESELLSRRTQLDELNKSKINMLYQAQMSGAHTMAIDRRYGGTINNAIMKAQGAENLILRIGELDDELRRRGYNQDKPD